MISEPYRVKWYEKVEMESLDGGNVCRAIQPDQSGSHSGPQGWTSASTAPAFTYPVFILEKEQTPSSLDQLCVRSPSPSIALPWWRPEANVLIVGVLCVCVCVCLFSPEDKGGADSTEFPEGLLSAMAVSLNTFLLLVVLLNVLRCWLTY